MALTVLALIRWKQGFTVLSMDRCLSFFEPMGLPSTITADPKPIVPGARNYLRKTSRITPAPSETPITYIESAQRCLDDAFSEVARIYDQDTAVSLHDWFVRYIIDDDHVVALSLWRELFRKVCRLVETVESTLAAPLDDDGMKRLCGVVHTSLAPEPMRQTRQRIREAHSLTRSEWESWLEEEVSRAAGEGQSLGAVEMALDLVESVVTSHRTFQACQRLKKELSSSERNRLVVWADRQAADLGFPRNALRQLAVPIN